MNNAAINMGGQKSVQVPTFSSFGYISRSEIVGSYGNSMFNFLRNHHTVFQNGCTILYSHQKGTRVHLSWYDLLFSVFLIIAILPDMKWYIIVILICIYPMISDVEHFFHMLIGYLYIFFEEVSI